MESFPSRPKWMDPLWFGPEWAGVKEDQEEGVEKDSRGVLDAACAGAGLEMRLPTLACMPGFCRELCQQTRRFRGRVGGWPSSRVLGGD
jgi:hypothetical protein